MRLGNCANNFANIFHQRSTAEGKSNYHFFYLLISFIGIGNFNIDTVIGQKDTTNMILTACLKAEVRFAFPFNV